MKRERATRLLADTITRLESGGWPLGLVDEVYVFGSYARGALEPNDVDVVIEHGTDKRWLGDGARRPPLLQSLVRGHWQESSARVAGSLWSNATAAIHRSTWVVIGQSVHGAASSRSSKRFSRSWRRSA